MHDEHVLAHAGFACARADNCFVLLMLCATCVAKERVVQ